MLTDRNPSPEPSAESLAEARVLCSAKSIHWLDRQFIEGDWVPNCGQCTAIASALDAAKRSSRREALGQAADVCEPNEYDCNCRSRVRALVEAE